MLSDLTMVCFHHRTTLILGLNCKNRRPRVVSTFTVGFNPRGKEVVSYCSVR
jgi:hypothetical protein